MTSLPTPDAVEAAFRALRLISTYTYDEFYRLVQTGQSPLDFIGDYVATLEELRAALEDAMIAGPYRMPSGDWRKDLGDLIDWHTELNTYMENTIARAEPETTPDAVEALHAALLRSSSVDDFSSGAPAEVIKHLNDQGFTIARAEPEGIRHSAVADYLKDDKGLRPASAALVAPMSDVELERRATMLVVGIRTGKYNVGEVVELVKKYRGQS